MEAMKIATDKFDSILARSYLKAEYGEEQVVDKILRHLIHDELNEQEHRFIEENHLYEWLFPYFYTQEERQVLEQFAQLVDERKTVIYGAGAVARLLLNCGFYGKIEGVMAAGQAGTLFCGKPFMSENQVLQAGVSQIVVAARVTNYQIITERISDFCEKNGILLRGLNGRNLIQWYAGKTVKFNPKDRMYFGMNAERLREEINRHDVISFDVFDTLVMRKVLRPADIFYLVGQQAKGLDISASSFADRRIYAEHHNVYEGNIFGIYRMLQDILQLTDQQRDRLLELEIEMERQLLILREEIADIFRYAVSQGKTVYLISDMYLPEPVLGKLLSGLGIIGYEKLMVSCDFHCGKAFGLAHIYSKMVMGRKCLHIGDNENADGTAFVKEGIDSFIIRSAFSLSKMSNLRNLTEYAYSKDEQNALGLLFSKILNSPFALNKGKGMIQVRTYKEWGYQFLGMYVVAYFDWLCREIKKNKLAGMLFPTRDGYLFYKLYCWYRKNVDGSLPEAVYFKTSRKICYVASLTTEENIDFFLGYDDVYSPEELLMKRFLLEKEEIGLFREGMDRREYIMMHKEIIFRRSAVIREKYLLYMRGLGLREGAEYGLFDSYCRGTVQYLLEQFTPYTLCGLYLGKIHNTRKLGKIKSFYRDRGNYLRLDDVNEKRTLMEYCFSSPETNIIGMDLDGNFIYAKEYRTKRDIEHMLEIQKGAEDFFMEYHGSFQAEEDGFSSDLPNAVINAMDQAELVEKCSDMGDIRSIDDMTNIGYAVWEC